MEKGERLRLKKGRQERIESGRVLKGEWKGRKQEVIVERNLG